MFFLMDLGGIAILILGVIVGMKVDKWFGTNHKNLHSIYKHLGVKNFDEAMSKIDHL